MVLKKSLTEAGGVRGRWKKGGREGRRKGEREGEKERETEEQPTPHVNM